MESRPDKAGVSTKRGRPRKLSSTTTSETVIDQASAKRKVGRPRRVQSESQASEEKEYVETECDEPKPKVKVVKTQRKRDLPEKSRWGDIVGNCAREFIPTNRLPTNRVVLQRYQSMRLKQSNRTTIHQFSNQLYTEIKHIWERTSIPLLEKNKCMYRITTLLNSWTKNNCRKMVRGSDQETSYVRMLDSLCSMTYDSLDEVKSELRKQRLLRGESSPEASGKERWLVEYDFLVNQMQNPQVGSIDGRDKILEEKTEKKMKRGERMRERATEREQSSSRMFTEANEATNVEVECLREAQSVIGTETETDGSKSSDDSDYVYVPPTRRIRKPKKLDKIMLELPTKDLMKDMASLSARLKLSQRAATSVYAKIILSGGGELKDFVISKSSTWRQRITAEKETEAKLKLQHKELSTSNPYKMLHWDGKKVKFQSGDIEEHLVICLQQVSSGKQPQFIAAPQTPDGTGAAQCEAIVRYVDQCGIEDQIIGHVWDTTASNTGKNTGSAKLLDTALGRANLWFGCRRHASERHIVHANEAVVGKTSSPEDQLHKHFKANFKFIDANPNHLQTFPWEGDEMSPCGPYKFTTERALEVKKWAEECCVKGSFPREDYRELLELITHVLGGSIKRRSMVDEEAAPRAVTFKMEQPGAFHHARFMAKAIYYVKMYMTLPQLLENNLITDLQQSQVERMALFVILLYGQYFLQTALTTAAPRLDLTFWRNGKKYECIDAEISESVERSVHLQMFYLTAELVVLALCDRATSDAEKESIVKALLETDRPQSFEPMKPAFKVDLLLGKLHDEPKLADFVGPRSWLIFDLLDVDVQWMADSPSLWVQHPDFVRFNKIVNSIICVNDCAERNVKNVCDYAEYSKDPERRDRAVVVVNHHRELVDFQRMTKEELSHMYGV